MASDRFTLFLAGDAPPSADAREAVRRLLDHYLPERYELRIVDVLEDPRAAEEARILATPVLDREDPPARAVGAFTDPEAVAVALGLLHTEGPA